MSAQSSAAAWRVERYRSEHAPVWEAAVVASGNGPFLLRRSYLDYHADRFEDFSWLIWRGDVLRALFVAGRGWAAAGAAQDLLVAHPGLPYGGLVYALPLTYQELGGIMTELRAAWRAAGFRQLLIRPVPRAFCRRPSDALAYWLHEQGAGLSQRGLNSVIDLTLPLRAGKSRRNNLRLARRHGLAVDASQDYAAFWAILTENLARRHGARPVHMLAEITYLQQHNPAHISLYVARIGPEMVAGVVLYHDAGQGFAHTQYIASSALGQQTGAVDAVLAYVTEWCAAAGYQRLSLGTSMPGGVLSAGLLSQKEGAGAVGEVQDTYLLELGDRSYEAGARR